MPYNNIYETLVARAKNKNEPLAGLIAYALYKQQKSEFYDKYAKLGTPVTVEQRDIFHATFTETALLALEGQARQLIFAFADDYLEADIAERQKTIIEESVSKKVDTIVGKLEILNNEISTKIEKGTSFAKAFWPGMAASLAFLLVTATVAIAWSLSSPDTMKNFLKVFAPK